MEGKDLFSQIASTKDNIKSYIEAKSSYYGVLAFEKAVKFISRLLANIFLMMAGLLALLFLSGAAAIYLGQLLDSNLYGMLIVAGVYLLVLFVLIAARKRIFGRISIRIVRQVFVSDDDEPTETRT